MKSIRLSFENHAGTTLAGRLDMPGEEIPETVALFAHCFTCSKDFKAVAHIGRALTDAGMAVFRFDFTGLGESLGAFADTTFSSNVNDLVAAAGFLEREYRAPVLLIGHSLGGAAVLQAARRIPASRAVVTIGAPADPGHVMRHMETARQQFEKTGEADVMLAGRRIRLKKTFLDDLNGRSMADTIQHLNRALLILHSPLDEVVGIENAAAIFAAARHPKSFLCLDRADHLLTDRADSRYAGQMIAAWAARYTGTSIEMGK